MRLPSALDGSPYLTSETTVLGGYRAVARRSDARLDGIRFRAQLAPEQVRKPRDRGDRAEAPGQQVGERPREATTDERRLYAERPKQSVVLAEEPVAIPPQLALGPLGGLDARTSVVENAGGGEIGELPCCRPEAARVIDVVVEE